MREVQYSFAVSASMRGEGVIFNVWRRKIRNAEERPEVLIDEFCPVREDIVLGPFPTHLGLKG